MNENFETFNETKENAPASEPYRFRYENGEKAEDTRYNYYYYESTPVSRPEPE